MPDFAPTVRRRRAFALVALAVAGAGLAFALRPRAAAEDPIRAERVERRTIVRAVSVSGHLDVTDRVELPSPASGALQSLDVDVGDPVVVGQPLAHLDTRQVDLAFGTAQAAASAATSRVEAARVAVDSARTDLSRLESLVPNGLASPAEVESARSRLAQLEANRGVAVADRSAASTTLTSARDHRTFAILRSPIAGVVLAAPRNVGGLVGPERGPLFVIGSGLDVLRIDAAVGEADIGDVAPGRTATFEVPAFLGRTFQATVTRIDPQATVVPGATTFNVRLRAENPDGVLRSGMTAMLHIVLARAENVLSVHEAALRFTPEGAPPAPPRTRVWKRAGPARLEPVDVVVGVSDGSFTEIRPSTPGALDEGSEIAVGVSVADSGRAGLSLGAGTRRAP